MTSELEVAKGIWSEIAPAIKSVIAKVKGYYSRRKLRKHYAELELRFKNKFLEKNKQFIELISTSRSDNIASLISGICTNQSLREMNLNKDSYHLASIDRFARISLDGLNNPEYRNIHFLSQLLSQSIQEYVGVANMLHASLAGVIQNPSIDENTKRALAQQWDRCETKHNHFLHQWIDLCTEYNNSNPPMGLNIYYQFLARI